VAFDWPGPGDVIGKVEEECAELRDALGGRDEAAAREEIGDLLFTIAQLARHLRLDPEAALRSANAKFERRFRRIENWLSEQGRVPGDAAPAELESLWARAKQEPG
jgi:ATP diphosphatase